MLVPKKKKVTVVADQTLVILFVGRRREIDKTTGETKLVIREAPTRRVNGAHVFDLPSDTDQKKGFTHPDAEKLLRLYPKDFKIKTPKGKKVK
jgi:hypothetical protein